MAGGRGTGGGPSRRVGGLPGRARGGGRVAGGGGGPRPAGHAGRHGGAAGLACSVSRPLRASLDRQGPLPSVQPLLGTARHPSINTATVCLVCSFANFSFCTSIDKANVTVYHLISQAGWNSCNLSIYLSIYTHWPPILSTIPILSLAFSISVITIPCGSSCFIPLCCFSGQ